VIDDSLGRAVLAQPSNMIARSIVRDGQDFVGSPVILEGPRASVLRSKTAYVMWNWPRGLQVREDPGDYLAEPCRRPRQARSRFS